MALKDIITLVDRGGPRNAVKVAIDLAAQADAHLTGLALAYDPIMPGYLVAPMPADYLEEMRTQSETDATTSVKAFEEAAARAGISRESRIARIAGSGMADPFVAQTRLSDLIVIGQEDADAAEPMREILIEAALFESGVPVLIVPYAGATKFSADHVMIAWDGSRTAIRAVHAALPVLEMAKKISVVIVDTGQKRSGEPGADLATYLSRHGFKVNVEVIASPQTSVADALLNFVSDNGVDMAVMGGYGHSRMREFVLGGATRGILKSMTVPVVMAH